MVIRAALAGPAVALALAGGALGAPHHPTQTPDYLARHGIPSPAGTLYRVAPLPGEVGHAYSGITLNAAGEVVPGPALVTIAPDLTPPRRTTAVLHEYAHVVSFPGWESLDCAVPEAAGICEPMPADDPQYAQGWRWRFRERAILRLEEGLTAAFTRAHLATYWRWLNGRRITPEGWADSGAAFDYAARAALWRRAAVSATGQPASSRAVREWLGAALLLDPLARARIVAP